MSNNNTIELNDNAHNQSSINVNALRSTAQSANNNSLPFRPPEGSDNQGCWEYMKKEGSEHTYTFTFLVILGLLSGSIGYVMDFVISIIYKARYAAVESYGASASGMAIWCLLMVALIVLAMLLVHFVSPAAQGSGIPPLKAMLNGAVIEDALSMRTLIVKLLTSIPVFASGVFVGKVEAMVHISAALAANMLKFPLFKSLRESTILRDQLISCGCAIGIASNFGAPAGGVLFAVEVIGSYYNVRAYYKSFFAALFAAIASKFFQAIVSGTDAVPQSWDLASIDSGVYSIAQFFSFILLGVFMGIMGALFTFSSAKVIAFFQRFGQKNFLNLCFRQPEGWWSQRIYNLFSLHIIITLITTILTGVFTYPYFIGYFMSMEPKALIEDLFLGTSIYNSPPAHTTDWKCKNCKYSFDNLAVFIVVRYIGTILSVYDPYPGGTFVPTFIVGAASGRIFGDYVNYLFPTGINGKQMNSGGYAVLGAAALTAGTTHAFSTAFIALEMVGLFHLPVFVCVVTSIMISKSFYINIYDLLIRMEKWHCLCEMNTDNQNMLVSNIMVDTEYERICIPRKTTKTEIQHLLDQSPNYKQFAVVKSMSTMTFVGSVPRYVLEDFLIFNADDTLSGGEDDGMSDNENKNTEIISIPEDNIKHPKIRVPVDASPYNLEENTTVTQAHALFAMMMLEYAYVLRNRRLVGVVERTHIKAEAEKQGKIMLQRMYGWIVRKLKELIWRGERLA